MLFITSLFLLVLSGCRLGIPDNPSDPTSADWSNAGVQGGIPFYSVGINVKDYGAVGDGVIDDTQAILNAIADCPKGQAVFLPAGSYLTTEDIAFRKSIVLRGEGPESTCLIQDYNGYGIQIGYNDPELPTALGVSWAGIEDLHLQTRYPFPNASGTRIYLNSVTNSWIKNIWITGYSYLGIRLLATSHCEIRDCFLRTTYEFVDWEVPTGDHGGSYGIILDGMNETLYANMQGSEGRKLSDYNLVENNILDWFRHALVTGNW